MNELRIGERRVGGGQPTFVVAELSGNHGGSIERAREIIRAAATAGCDAVKLQTYRADTMTLPIAEGPFVVSTPSPWTGRSLYALYQEAATPWEWHEELFALARSLGLIAFSTPFDASAIALLEQLGAPCYKIASFELVDHELIAACARTQKPIILSTGMATLDEIADAVGVVRAAGNEQIVLLKCTSAYPSPPSAMNLRSIPELAARFGALVGLSDHTLTTAVPAAAVALGACVVEKHATLRRADPGPDASFSLEPHELAELVTTIRVVEQALGAVHFGPTDADRASLAFRRSLVVVADVPQGAVFTRDNVRALRPGGGLAPKHLHAVLGRRAARALSRGAALQWEDVEGDDALTPL